MRYIVQQPRTLESLAIAKCGDWIALRAEELLSRPIIVEDFHPYFEAVRTHLDKNIPPNILFRDKLVIEATRALEELFRKAGPSWQFIGFKERSDIIGRMTETFIYDKNLTSLSLHQIGMYVPSFSESYLLTGLISLEIQGFEDIDVIPMLKELHNLRIFKYVFKCTNEVLRCLVVNCKLIEELNLSYTKTRINDESIDIMIQFSNLRSVKLLETSVTEEGVEKLLLACKNIEFIAIDTENKRTVINAIEYIAENYEWELTSNATNIQFKLNNFHDRLEGPLDLVVKMCPLIQEIRLDRDDMSPDYVTHLNNLQELRVLELSYFDFYTDNVEEVLKVRGRNLVKLVLDKVNEIDVNAFMCLNKMCPNLESLNVNFAKSASPYDFFLENDVEISPFIKLHTLSLSGRHPAEDQLFYILSKCPKVKFLTIEKRISLTDTIMLRVLNKNPLSCLKKFKSYNKLTMVVIDQIVQNCTGLEVEDLYPDRGDQSWESSEYSDNDEGNSDDEGHFDDESDYNDESDFNAESDFNDDRDFNDADDENDWDDSI